MTDREQIEQAFIDGSVEGSPIDRDGMRSARMTPDQRERFAAVIEGIDVAVAGRPDIIASPVGFVVGALVGAGRSDLDGTYAQLAGFADVLAYVVAYVNGHPEASVERIVAAILPPA